MASIGALRKEAKNLGISPKKIRGASSTELQELINVHGENGSKPRAKAKKKGTTRKAVRRTATKADRPKRSTAKRTQSGRSKTTPAAKSTQGKAKRSSTATDSGRNLIEALDFSKTDGWNPRDGSPPDRIIKALRKARGNREKVFDVLLPKIGDFVGAKKRDGSKHSKASREDMLMYRINRTAWEFALRTGQHQPSENRVAYGTGGTGTGVFKPARKRAAEKRSAAKRSTAKRGASSKRSTAKRASQKRTGTKRGGKRKASKR